MPNKKIIHLDILLEDFFNVLEEIRPDVTNAIAFTETNSGELRFQSTGHDIAFLTYAIRELIRERDKLLDEEYGEDVD